MHSPQKSPVSQQLDNYLRSHRKRTGLSQTEAAFVLGCRSGTRVSRHERFVRTPGLRNALAYETLYRAPVRELFAGLYEKVEKGTLQRAWLLALRLGKRPPTVTLEWKLRWIREQVGARRPRRSNS